MATTIGKLNFLVGADSSGVAAGLRPGMVAIKSMGSGSGLGGLGSLLAGGGLLAGAAALTGGLLALGAGAVAVGTGSIRAAAGVESLGVSFEVMLGSADKASSMLQQIRDFANTTPLDTSSLAESAKTLLQFGVAGESIMPTLKMIGDVSAGDANKLQSLALVFGQVSSAGKLMGGDLLQLINAGFNPLKQISEATGIAYGDLRKKMEAGAISSDMVTSAFKLATMEGGRFNGMLEKQADTVTGKWSTLQDGFANLGTLIGDTLSPATKAFLDLSIEGVEFLVFEWKNLALAVGEVVKLLAAVAKKMIEWSKWWRGAEEGTSHIKALGESADSVRAKLKALLGAPSNGDIMKGLKDSLKSVKDQIKEVEDRHKKMQDALEGRRGVFTSAAIRGTTEGTMAIARTSQEGLIQKELVHLREALVTELKGLKEQEKAVERAIEKKEPIEVTEARI